MIAEILTVCLLAPIVLVLSISLAVIVIKTVIALVDGGI